MAFYNESSLGYCSGLLEQASSTPLLLSSGNPYHQLSHEDCIISAIYGWKRLAKCRSVLRPGLKEFQSYIYIYRNIVCIYIYILANRRAFAVPLVAMQGVQ